MEKFVVVSMDEQGEELAKVLSNKTAVGVMNKLSEKGMSATELSRALNIPLPTIDYNLNLLIKTNLVRKTSYKYSEKGKKVFYYEPSKKMIIISPNKSTDSMISLVREKLFVPILLGATALVGVLMQRFWYTGPSLESSVTIAGGDMVSGEVLAERSGMIVEGVTGPSLSSQPWFIFFLGGLFFSIILVLFYLVNKKGGKIWKNKA